MEKKHQNFPMIAKMYLLVSFIAFIFLQFVISVSQNLFLADAKMVQARLLGGMESLLLNMLFSSPNSIIKISMLSGLFFL